MRIDQVREIARKHGIYTARMAKADIVRAIQRAEGNFDCFGSAVNGFSYGRGEARVVPHIVWRRRCRSRGTIPPFLPSRCPRRLRPQKAASPSAVRRERPLP